MNTNSSRWVANHHLSATVQSTPNVLATISEVPLQMQISWDKVEAKEREVNMIRAQ
jgi:hypothetical protein